MRRRQATATADDVEIPWWVRQSPRIGPDGVCWIGKELAAMPGAPTAADVAARSDPEWPDGFTYLCLLRDFGSRMRREWCAERGLVIDAARIGVAVQGPIEALYSPVRGLYGRAMEEIDV